RAVLRGLDSDVVAAEAAVSASGGGRLADVVARHEALRERARGLVAVLAERRRSAERDRGALLDRDVVATLEAEAARVRGQLGEVETEAGALVPRADELSDAEQVLAQERAAFAEQWGDGAPLPARGEAA